MAEVNENMIKFGYLNENEIAEYISGGELQKYNVCFTKDTKRIFLINGNLDLVPLKTRISIYGSVEAAIEQINNDSGAYDGELISVKNGDSFDAYIICSYSSGQKYIKPVYEEADLDYDLLQNAPIKNIKGTVSEPITLSNLDDGHYKITGVFITPKGTQVTSIVGEYIMVDTISTTEKVIKRIASDNIFDYVVKNDGTYTMTQYATQQYIIDQGYTTESYVDNKITALKAELEEYIKDYIDNTVTLLIKYLIDQELDSRYSSEEDINNLFNK